MSLASLDGYTDDRLSPFADAVAGIVFYSVVFAMSLANLAGLYILAPVIRTALRDHEARGLNKR